ncbi:alpha/beta hydrolase family protein [Marisediminicola senii]|uniref:alpha/beta hydrolase family protein n=1 Tax=Marisediminicola senii TaxID=2711233 RepID=UPI0013EC2F24|nr:dipeptidyl aminopeptidase [Marisediminicola senii]
MPHDLAFSPDPAYDYEIRGVLGVATGGASDLGEVLAATSAVGKDHEKWFVAWRNLAQRTLETADVASAGGHPVSAAGAYLRASAYFGVAVNALAALPDALPGDPTGTNETTNATSTNPAGANETGPNPRHSPLARFARPAHAAHPDLTATFRLQTAAWNGFLSHTALDVTPFAIAYGDDGLPGWFFRAPKSAQAAASKSGATLVAVNGSDGSLASLFGGIASSALDRGYNVLLFDGPGQQSQLFDRGTTFRPDFEAVLTPVYTAVARLDGVDPTRIAVYGISQAGFWVPRALASEHRFAAAIADPGIVDVSTSWLEHIPKSLVTLLDEAKHEAFDRDMGLAMKVAPVTARTWRFRARPYGADGYASTLEQVRRHTLTDEQTAAITTPLLITAPEDEQFWPGQSEQLAARTASVSTLVRFTATEGASGHCQPLARTLTAQRILDWLDTQLEG